MPDPSSSGGAAVGFLRTQNADLREGSRSLGTRLTGGLSCGGSIWHEIKLSTKATLLRPLDVHPRG